MRFREDKTGSLLLASSARHSVYSLSQKSTISEHRNFLVAVNTLYWSTRRSRSAGDAADAIRNQRQRPRHRHREDREYLRLISPFRCPVAETASQYPLRVDHPISSLHPVGNLTHASCSSDQR